MQGCTLKIRSKKKSFHQTHSSHDVDAQDHGRWFGTCLPVGTTTTLPCWRISKEGEPKMVNSTKVFPLSQVTSSGSLFGSSLIGFSTWRPTNKAVCTG